MVPRFGFEIENCESVQISHAEIVGVSETQKEVMKTKPVPNLCSYQGISGILLSPYRVSKNTDSGINLINTHFQGFDSSQDCPKSFPIDFIAHTKDSHWDVSSSLKNVSITDARSLYINGCTAASINVNDVVITDIDGSLNSDSSQTTVGPSTIVSSKSYMTTFAPGTCTDLPDQCLSYCENTCLRTVAFQIDHGNTEDFTLVVKNADGTKSIEVPGSMEEHSNPFYNNLPDRYRVFSASLPSGEYTAGFYKDGIPAHPSKYFRHVDDSEYFISEQIVLNIFTFTLIFFTHSQKKGL